MASTAAVAEEVTVYYPDMPPFLVGDPAGGRPTGALALAMEKIAREARVEVRWHGPVPRSRILQEMVRGVGAICTPNVLMTPEREAMGLKFTSRITRPGNWAVVARADAPWLGRHKSFTELRLDPTLVMGRRLGASADKNDDRLLGDMPNERSFRASSAELLVVLDKMRIDYVLLPAEDLPLLAAANDLSTDRFTVVRYPDLAPSTDGGRIMCSPSTSDDIMSRLELAVLNEYHGQSN